MSRRGCISWRIRLTVNGRASREANEPMLTRPPRDDHETLVRYGPGALSTLWGESLIAVDS